MSVIHAAASRGDLHLLRQLLRQQPSLVNETCPSDGQTPLSVAVAANRPAAVKLLIRAGADVNHVARGGQTPVCYAAVKGDLMTLKMLVEAGADLSKGAINDLSPLLIAALHGHVPCTKYLISQSPVSVVAEAEMTPLSMAAATGHVRLVEELLAHPIAASANSKARALTMAAAAGRLEIARLLIKAGATATNSTVMEQNTLFNATNSSRHEIMELLVKEGKADVNVASLGSVRDTALGMAARKGDLKGMEILLAANADVNAGMGVALYMALLSSQFAAADVLLARGANPNLPCNCLRDNMVALHDITQQGNLEAVKWLLAGIGVSPDPYSSLCELPLTLCCSQSRSQRDRHQRADASPSRVLSRPH